MRYPDLPDVIDGYGAAEENDDIGVESNIGGFVELFYLWCATYNAGEASMLRFEVTPTGFVAEFRRLLTGASHE
jgi:hypothetical protein